MTKENIKDQEINNEAGFREGEGYPSCEGEPCAKVADEQQETANVADEPAAEVTKIIGSIPYFIPEEKSFGEYLSCGAICDIDRKSVV